MPIPDYLITAIESGLHSDIDISGQGFLESDVDELVERLNKQKSVTSLTLYRLRLSNACTSKLAQLRFIKKLDIIATNISDDGILPLITKSNFTHLDLSRNNLSKHAADIIMKYSQQVWINISENPGIDDNDIRLVNESLKNNKARHLKNMLMGQSQKTSEQTPAPTVAVGNGNKSTYDH